MAAVTGAPPPALAGARLASVRQVPCTSVHGGAYAPATPVAPVAAAGFCHALSGQRVRPVRGLLQRSRTWRTRPPEARTLGVKYRFRMFSPVQPRQLGRKPSPPAPLPACGRGEPRWCDRAKSGATRHQWLLCPGFKPLSRASGEGLGVRAVRRGQAADSHFTPSVKDLRLPLAKDPSMGLRRIANNEDHLALGHSRYRVQPGSPGFRPVSPEVFQPPAAQSRCPTSSRRLSGHLTPDAPTARTSLKTR